MKRQQLTTFYLEALLLVLVFVGMILVLTGVFGAARAQSAEARQLTRAVDLAANAAEAVAAADDPATLAALLDEGGNVRLSGGEIEADYEADGSPCTDGSPALRVCIGWESAPDDAALVYSAIRVFAAGDEEPVYRLETATRVGRAAA